MIRIPLVLAVLISLAVSGPSSQSPDAIDLSSLEAVALNELKITQTPGAAVAVVFGDRVIYARGFGVANVETREPVQPEMLFRLGSTTKMFTAAAVVSLAQRGALDLERPIGGYVTGLNPEIARLTANQLLSHTAGFLDEAPYYGSNDETALAKEVRSWTGSRFFTEPSKIYSYSNPGYWLAGFLAESVSGKPFADQMDDSVFKPMGMVRTTFRPLVAMTYPMADGHAPSADGAKVVRPVANNTASWPAGSLYSSVTELARFVSAFVNNGRLGAVQVMSPGVIAKMTTPRVKLPGSDVSYGYGLELLRSGGVDVVRHGGSRSGYGSTILMVPSRRFGVIAIANRTASAMNRTASKAMELALALEPPPATPTLQPVALSPSEVKRVVGTYSQGLETLRIEDRAGRAFFKQGNLDEELLKMTSSVLESDNVRLTVVSGANGAVEYLYAGGRAWRKVQ